MRRVVGRPSVPGACSARRRLTHRRRGERGSVLVEFVLILPVFLLLLFGGLDMAITVNGFGSFSSAVSQGTSLIAAGNQAASTDPCVMTMENPVPVPPGGDAPLAAAQLLCEVTNELHGLSPNGVDLNTLELAIVCETSTSGTPPAGCADPTASSFVVCAKAQAKSLTGLLQPILNHIWASGVGTGPLTGTASTIWSFSSYNTNPTGPNMLVCPPAPFYTVTFNNNGGSGTMAPETANTPTALTLNSFVPPAGPPYTNFVGWSTTPGGPVAYLDGQTYPFDATNGSVTLYAVWQ